jgi:hypothetical protein
MIINLINKFINSLNTFSNKYTFNNNHNIKYTQSSLFIIIMNYLGLILPEGVEPIAQYIFGVITLSLISLICFINVCIYLLIIYFFKEFNIEEKYPILKTNKILKWIIKRYKQTTILFIIIDLAIGLITLIILIILSVIGFKSLIN